LGNFGGGDDAKCCHALIKPVGSGFHVAGGFLVGSDV